MNLSLRPSGFIGLNSDRIWFAAIRLKIHRVTLQVSTSKYGHEVEGWLVMHACMHELTGAESVEAVETAWFWPQQLSSVSNSRQLAG